MLVIALLGSMFMVNRLESDPSDPSGRRLAAVTSPVASATPAPDVASEPEWTDPGHTNAFPAGFDPESAQPAKPIIDLDFDSETGLIVGDTLILAGSPGRMSPGEAVFHDNIIGIDLLTGEKAWSRARPIVGQPVAGAHAFYTVDMISENRGETNFMIVSVSPDTGLPNWGHTVLTVDTDQFESLSTSHPRIVGNPVVIDNTVYIATTTGNVSAYDTESGSLLWQSSDVETPYPQAAVGGFLTGDDRFLYVVDGDNNVIKRDRATGNVIDTFEIADRLTTDTQRRLLLQNNVLVVHSWMLGGPRNDVDVISTETGEVLWSSHIAPLVGSVAITDGIIGIPYIAGLDGTPTSKPIPGIIQISFYDLETGEPVSDYIPPESGSASLSASGSVICVHEKEPAISCVDFDDSTRTLRSIDVGAQYTAEGPPSPVLFWNGNAIVLGHEGGPHMIRSNGTNTAQTPAAATPAASPEASAKPDTKLS
jgi:outer membrane protein assembly factor BamB